MPSDDEILLQRNTAFVRAWKAGERPDLRSLVSDLAEPLRSELFRILLTKEISFLTRQGQPPSTADYHAAFPEFNTIITSVFGAPDTPPTTEGATPPEVDRLPRFPGFVTVKPLGQGGQGHVYLVRRERSGEEFALKQIAAGASASPKARARFRAEAEITARLRDPRIVRIHAIEETGDVPTLLLEYVDGPTLEEQYRQERPSLTKAATIVAELAEAMAFAHAAQIVHRDLKPSNVLIGPGDELKITDFGTARDELLDRNLTDTAAALGTPAYMAPEQARDARQVDARSDVYALGAILYYLLTGRPPAAGDSPATILQSVMEGTPKAPSDYQPGIPPSLEAICLKCLAKYPSERYPSASLLAADLRAFSQGEPVRHLSSTSSTVQTRPWWEQRGPCALIAGLGGWMIFFLLPLMVYSPSDGFHQSLAVLQSSYLTFSRLFVSPAAVPETNALVIWWPLAAVVLVCATYGYVQRSTGYIPIDSLVKLISRIRKSDRSGSGRVVGLVHGILDISPISLVLLLLMAFLPALNEGPIPSNQNVTAVIAFIFATIPLLLAGIYGVIFGRSPEVSGGWLRHRPGEWLLVISGLGLFLGCVADPLILLFVRPLAAAAVGWAHTCPGDGLVWVLITRLILIIALGRVHEAEARPTWVAARVEALRHRIGHASRIKLLGVAITTIALAGLLQYLVEAPVHWLLAQNDSVYATEIVSWLEAITAAVGLSLTWLSRSLPRREKRSAVSETA